MNLTILKAILKNIHNVANIPGNTKKIKTTHHQKEYKSVIITISSPNAPKKSTAATNKMDNIVIISKSVPLFLM